MTEWNRLQAWLWTGSISRRNFLGRAAALGVSTALVTDGLAQTPKRGGHLIVGFGGAGTGDTLDPARYTSPYSGFLQRHGLYENLAAVDERARVHPWLAESWDVKPGAREWVIKLRKGITFHNGKDFSAADVLFSLNYHRGKDSKSPAKALLTPVKEIQATDKYEITITLDSPYADIPALLGEPRLSILPQDSKFDGTGTGPFILDSFQPGIRAITKRNPNYWRTDRGFVDSVEILAINDPTARMSALQSGAIHLMNRVDPRAIEVLGKNAQIQVFTISGAAHMSFPMRCDRPPYDNLDLRLALKYAIDRESILKTVTRGHGKIGNDQPIPSYDPFFAPDIPQRPYDPHLASFHFKKAGYGGPIVLSVAESSFSGAIEAVQVFQASAAKVGITLQIDRVPADAFWSDVWMKRPFVAAYWFGRSTADLMLSSAYASDASWNETFWRRPKFDQLLVAARGELNFDKRKQMYREMQLMIHEDGGAIIPVFSNWLDAGVWKVRGFVPHPLGELSAARAPAMVWLDA